MKIKKREENISGTRAKQGGQEDKYHDFPQGSEKGYVCPKECVSILS